MAETLKEQGAIEKVQRVGASHSITHALLFLGMGGTFALAAALFGAWAGWSVTPYVSMFLFFACGLCAVALVFKNEGKIGGQISNLIDAGVRAVDAEIQLKLSIPPAPSSPTPALPAENESFRFNHFSRGGEDVPKNLLHGFDPRDLDFLFRLMSRGFKFTEEAMEKLELPYSHELMGKAQAGTNYTRFIDVCVRAGIIVDRRPKNSGTLAIADPLEMMKSIKALPLTT